MTKPLVLKAVHSTAVTYSFETSGSVFKSWALCTVNDRTGELLITSDWGNWAHRWSADPESLGAASLTAFIGKRFAQPDPSRVDYLARKLQPNGQDRRWSAEATVKALKRVLCERRLEDGRNMPGYPHKRLCKEDARLLWDRLDSHAEDDNETLFCERFRQDSDLCDYITDEPHEYRMTEQTSEDRMLREFILPALIEACRLSEIWRAK